MYSSLKIQMLFGHRRPDYIRKFINHLYLGPATKKKIFIAEVRPIPLSELYLRSGKEALENAKVCIEKESINKRLVDDLRAYIKHTYNSHLTEAEKLSEDPLPSDMLGRLAALDFSFAELLIAASKGYDIAYEKTDPESIFAYWLSEKYKGNFYSIWQDRSHFDFQQMLNMAKLHYYYIFSHYSLRNSKFVKLLADSAEEYDLVATFRGIAHAGFFEHSFKDASIESFGNPYFSERLASERIEPEYLTDLQLAEIVKGLVFDFIKSDPSITSEKASKLIEKLPESLSGLEKFFIKFNKEFRKTSDPRDVARNIISYLSNGSPIADINRRLFLGLFFGAGILNVFSRVLMHRAEEKNAQKRLNKLMLKTAEEAKSNNKIDHVSTESGEFFFCLGMHSAGDFTAHAKDKIKLQALRELKNRYPALIYAPEVMIKYSPRSPNITGRNRSAQKTSYKEYLMDLSKLSLTQKGAAYFYKQNVPLLLLDSIIPETIDTHSFDMRIYSLSLRDVLFYVLPHTWGTALAYVFSNKNLEVSLRDFVKIFGIGSAALIETALNYKFFKKRWEREFWNLPFSIYFRNALMAYKLLRFGREYQEKYGKKPAILLTFGYAHKDIIENLKKGEAYNLQLIRKISRDLDLNLKELGKFIHKGYLFDPTKPDHLPMAEEFDFELIKKAIK
jgi:hypothetical protein